MKQMPRYIRTSENRFLIQIAAHNRWGFTLLSDDQSWPGGFGIANSWQVVRARDVPKADLSRLGTLREAQQKTEE